MSARPEETTRGAAAVVDLDTEATLEALEALVRAPAGPGGPAAPHRPDPASAPAPGGPSRPPHAAPAAHRRVATRLAGAWGVALAALAAGSLAWWFSAHHDLALIYADARSHLTIARRLLDGPTHSMVQLGTVWLPLPHVVVAPFTLLGALWSSGAAVVPVNLACLVVEALALFRIVSVAGRSRLGGWVAVGLLLTNPGWLYLHTTALGEPVLFAAMLATVAGLVGWVRSEKAYSGGELALFCGLPAAAGVLSRYDGWAMAAAAGAFVVVVAQLRWRQWGYSLRCLRGFALPSMVAAAWWLWFNFVNWGDPLEFQRGRYSAQAQQQLLADAGLLPDQGDLLRSVSTYFGATAAGAGPALLVAAALAGLAWAVAGRAHIRALAPWLLVVVPAGFYLLSLYTGQIAMRLGGADVGGSMFNLRYGLQVLPGLAALCGLGVAVLRRDRPGTLRPARLRRPASALAVAAVAVLALSWWPDWRAVPVVAEGLQQRELGAAAWAGAAYLRDHADEGLVMVDDSVNPMLPVVGIDLDRVVAPFSGEGWERALRNPRRAEWLFVDTAGGGDAVARALADRPHVVAAYDVAFTQGTVSVLHRRSAS